jgi:hypothetical protein
LFFVDRRDFGLLFGRERERFAEAFGLQLGRHATTATTGTAGATRTTFFGRRRFLRDADHGEHRGAQGEDGDELAEGGFHNKRFFG